MKAQFKYAFRAGMSPRMYVFAVIFVMNLAFIVLGMFGVLPLAAQITAVSLSGTAIGVIAVFNIIGDVSIIRRMFSAPGAVFYALTPVPRKKTLLASVITMFVTDFVTMTFSIFSVVILSFNLASSTTGLNAWEMLRSGTWHWQGILVSAAIVFAGYMFFMMLIIFCKAVRKSVLYNKPVGGLLAFLIGVGIFYLTTVSSLLLAPFGTVTRYYGFFTVEVGILGVGMYALILFVFAAIMFMFTSRLMERKMNI